MGCSACVGKGTRPQLGWNAFYRDRNNLLDSWCIANMCIANMCRWVRWDEEEQEYFVWGVIEQEGDTEKKEVEELQATELDVEMKGYVEDPMKKMNNDEDQQKVLEKRSGDVDRQARKEDVDVKKLDRTFTKLSGVAIIAS